MSCLEHDIYLVELVVISSCVGGSILRIVSKLLGTN